MILYIVSCLPFNFILPLSPIICHIDTKAFTIPSSLDGSSTSPREDLLEKNFYSQSNIFTCCLAFTVI
jgi:hypothetical protein